MFDTQEQSGRPATEERANAKARTIGMLIVAVVVPLLVIFLSYRLQFRQLVDTDAMDLAQVARNVAGNRGFVTSAVRPMALTIHKNPMDMPEMVQAPLFPVITALLLATNASDKRVFISAALFFLLTIPVLYALARAMFNQKVANLAAFAYVTSTLMLGVLTTASTGPLLAFLFTSLCLAMFRYAQAAADPESDRKRLLRYAAVAGVLTALLYLTDYLLIFMLLPAIVFVYMVGGQRRMPGLTAFLIAFLVPAGLWWVRNTVVGVNPFLGLRSLEIAMGTTTYPGMSLYRSTVPHSMLGLLQEVKWEVPRKMGVGLVSAYQNLASLGTPFLMAFFIVGLFYSFRRVGVNAVRGFVLASFLCVMLFGSLFLLQSHILAAFAPAFLAFAAAYFIRILTDSPMSPIAGRAVMTLAVLVFAFPMVTRFVLVRPGAQNPHEVESVIARKVAAGVPVLTDRVFEMAWYGSRTSIWLPSTEKDIQNVDAAHKQGALYLSAQMPSYGGAEFTIWQGFYRSALQGLASDQLMKVSGETLNDFALYRDMTQEDIAPLVQRGALLFMRPEGVRPTTR